MTDSLTQRVASLIVHAQPDEAACLRARQGLVDYLACTFPVLTRALPDPDLDTVRQQFPPTHAAYRALLLGYGSHALDYDDFHADLRGHPSAVILSTLFALLGTTSNVVTSSAFLAAYVTGVEMAARLGLAAGRQHYVIGFHTTATLGGVAATAAAARLLELSVAQTQVALGLAATQAAGLRRQMGSSTKPLHVGWAARAATDAVQLAAAGFDGQKEGVIESLLLSHGGSVEWLAQLTSDWGSPWRIVSPGLEFKRYPTCSGTHSAADAALRLRKQLLAEGLAPTDFESAIASISVRFPVGGDTAPAITGPVHGIEARFSLEYVIADALLTGALPLSHYTAAPVIPAIALLAKRVVRQPDASVPPDADNPDLRFHHVQLRLYSGRAFDVCVRRAESRTWQADPLQKLYEALSRQKVLDVSAAVADAELTSSEALQRWTKRLMAALEC
ncbi:MmgE/PrpD family protein [Zymobacter sp. IVIA_12111.31 C1]|uniref:MmgE/PrpD family protein n=1 Tax=Zymobacter sp. IVIA_12111.31 C1 TaxID=3394854 RepID=UPI0039C17252